MKDNHSKNQATKIETGTETRDARNDLFSAVHATEIDVGWYKVEQSNDYVAAVYVVRINSVTLVEHWYMNSSYIEPSSSATNVTMQFIRQGDVPKDFDGPSYAANIHPNWQYIVATCVKQ